SMRLFDVNYVNLRRAWQRGVRSGVSVDSQASPAADLAASLESDPLEELGKGVQAMLSESGRMHVDRAAGIVQVTDFSERLDQIGVYVETVQPRARPPARVGGRACE